MIRRVRYVGEEKPHGGNAARAGLRAGDVLLFEEDKTGVRVRPVRAKSPFAKYRGIGNRGIGSGKKAINRWTRKMRGR